MFGKVTLISSIGRSPEPVWLNMDRIAMVVPMTDGSALFQTFDIDAHPLYVAESLEQIAKMLCSAASGNGQQGDED